MISVEQVKRIIQDQRPYLLERYGIVEIGVFGSYVRDEQHVESDLDILVDLGDPPQIDLLDLVNLERHLSKVLGIKVDIAVKSNLRKRIGQRILNEVVPI
jgi:predicted nucleotidyltransferase